MRETSTQRLEELAKDFIATHLLRHYADGGKEGGNDHGSKDRTHEKQEHEHPVRTLNFAYAIDQSRDVEDGAVPGRYSAERLAPKKGKALLYKATRSCLGPTGFNEVPIHYQRDDVELFPPGIELPSYWHLVAADPSLVNEDMIGHGRLRREGGWRTWADGSQTWRPSFADQEERERVLEAAKRRERYERRKRELAESDFGLPIHTIRDPDAARRGRAANGL